MHAGREQILYILRVSRETLSIQTACVALLVEFISLTIPSQRVNGIVIHGIENRVEPVCAQVRNYLCIEYA